jgi:hypothetical protein
MRNYLPSKKFIYTLFSLVLAILIIYGVKMLAEKKVQPSANETLTNRDVTMEEFIVSDSDNDGLKNWEEALWKTDPEKSDTDNDGTSDKEEIKDGRNPVKANTAKASLPPNDKLDDETVAARKQAETEFAQLSTTDKVGRVLLAQYLVNKKVGEEINQTDIANVINNALSVIPEPVFTKYTVADLKIFKSTSTEQIKTYGDKTAFVLSSNRPKPLITFEEAISSIGENDTDAEIKVKLQKLGPLALVYKNISLGLLGVEVPEQFAAKHLELLNATSQMSDNLSQIIAAAEDPIKLLALINTYYDSAKRLWDASNAFSVL